LEETLLCVQKPECACGVGTGRRGNGRDAERVAFDIDRGTQAAKRDGAVKQRQTCAQLVTQV
jgi:hypothetical protein